MPAPSLDLGSVMSASAAALNGRRSQEASLQNQLNAAANQQATLKRQKDADYRSGLQNDFKDQLELADKGYTPTQIYPNGDPQPGRPTLQTPEDNPAAQGGGPTVTDTNGRQYTKKGLDDTNSFTLSDDLAAEAQKAGLTNIRSNTRYPKSDMGPLNERLAAYHKEIDPEGQVSESGEFTGPDGKTVRMNRGSKSGKLTPAPLPDGYSAATKPDKPDVSQIIPGMQGPNGGPLIYDKTSQSMKEIAPVPGSKGVLNADQQDRSQDRKVRMREADVRDAENQTVREGKKAETQQKIDEIYTKQHNDARAQEETHKSVAQLYWDAASTEPGQYYTVPRIINGVVTSDKQERMPDDRRERDKVGTRLQTLAKTAEGQAAEQSNNAKEIRRKRGWAEFAPAQTAVPAASGPPAQKQQPVQPTVAPPAPQVKLKASDVADWAKKNGKDPADALRRAKAKGLL
jgi:hypothetical protein